MTSAVSALLLSFALTSVFTPFVRRWAIRLGAVDQPGGRRVHLRVTPRLGGVAVMIGFFVPLAVFAVIQTGAMWGFLQQRNLVVGLVVGSAIVGLVGAWDDVRGLGPWIKLLAQAAAGVVAYVAGYRIDAVNIPLIGDVYMGVLALPVTVFWFLAITNAINLIDGLDGLAAGITLFATITNFAIANVNGADVVVLLSAGLSGSLLGFLRYNFNPATIFLGDSGSMFLGFTLAATSLAGGMTKSSTAVALLAPIIALGIPILDTLLAMIRRAVARQSIFAADRGHIHHRLLDVGFTHRRVVLVLYSCSVLLAVAAVAIAFGRSWNVGIALVLVGCMLFGLVRLGFRVPRAVVAPEPVLTGLAEGVLSVQLQHALSALLRVTEEAELRRILSQFEAAEPSLVRLWLLDSGSRPSLGQEPGRTYELELGPQRKRFIELRFCGEMLEEERNQLAATLDPLVEACRDALMRIITGHSKEAPRAATTAGPATGGVHAASSRG